MKYRSAVARYLFECQIAKTCHRKIKPSQCSQHCRGGGIEFANETGKESVQRVTVAQCFSSRKAESFF